MRIPRLAFLAAAALVAAGCSSDSTTAPAVLDIHPGIPSGWLPVGTGGLTYVVGLDNATTHGGHASLAIAGSDTSRLRFAGVGQLIIATAYLGKRVRLSAWVRTQNVLGTDIGLWMRIDGPSLMEGFDNFSSRPLVGTAGWNQVEIILDVPADAEGIAFGALMSGSGQFLVDDMKLEIIPATGLTTNLLDAFSAQADAAAFYASKPGAPTNLDFETP